jgi:hypothetical protein
MGGASGSLADGALFERVHTLACLVEMEKKMHFCGHIVWVAGTRFYAQHLLRALRLHVAAAAKADGDKRVMMMASVQPLQRVLHRADAEFRF